MTAAGLIFSNIHDSAVPQLTSRRTMASIPFGGRYRLIDFALSNMVNSGITKVGVITHNNYQSLLDHLGNGKDWDLARGTGGLKILPPFITAYDSPLGTNVYATRLEALLGVLHFIDRCTEDMFVLSDCDVICNVDLKTAMELHQARNADLTIVTAQIDAAVHAPDHRTKVLSCDENGRITDLSDYNGENGSITVCTDILLIRRTYLQRMLSEAMSHGYRHFYKDIVARHLSDSRCYTHPYDGFFARINSLESYFSCSMRLLNHDERVNLFYRRNQPVFTKVRNSAPTHYAPGAIAKNSLIADGCIVEGRVENSILFRGVKIGRNTEVKNSILMQDTVTGENVRLSCVIADKNAVIRDNRELCGHETLPFYIGKGLMV